MIRFIVCPSFAPFTLQNFHLYYTGENYSLSATYVIIMLVDCVCAFSFWRLAIIDARCTCLYLSLGIPVKHNHVNHLINDSGHIIRVFVWHIAWWFTFYANKSVKFRAQLGCKRSLRRSTPAFFQYRIKITRKKKSYIYLLSTAAGCCVITAWVMHLMCQ